MKQNGMKIIAYFVFVYLDLRWLNRKPLIHKA